MGTSWVMPAGLGCGGLRSRTPLLRVRANRSGESAGPDRCFLQRQPWLATDRTERNYVTYYPTTEQCPKCHILWRFFASCAASGLLPSLGCDPAPMGGITISPVTPRFDGAARARLADALTARLSASSRAAAHRVPVGHMPVMEVRERARACRGGILGVAASERGSGGFLRC